MNARLAALTLTLAITSGALPGLAHAKGGMGNGGIAIQCGNGEPTMIDAALPERYPNDLVYDIPATREAMLIRLKERLGKNLLLLAMTEHQFQKIGPSDSWPADEGNNTYDPFLSRKLPKDCRLLQMASFQKGWEQPRRRAENQILLSEPQKRALELHESFFMVGVKDFGHTHPVAARYLTSLILAKEVASADVDLAVDFFRQFEYYQQENTIAGVFRRAKAPRLKTPPTILDGRGCPEVIVVESVGFFGNQVGFFDLDREGSLQPRGISFRHRFRTDQNTRSYLDHDEPWTLFHFAVPKKNKGKWEKYPLRLSTWAGDPKIPISLGGISYLCSYERQTGLAIMNGQTTGELIRISDQVIQPQPLGPFLNGKGFR